MVNLFGLRKPNTNLRKNVFDLSAKTLYTQSSGMLLPVFSRELNPGEKVEFNLSAFVRTQPLNTAGFLRCRQYYHVFFVPFKQLWNGWDNFINGVDYKQSALQAGRKYHEVPSINFFLIVKRLIEGGRIHEEFGSPKNIDGRHDHLDEHGYKYYYGISRVLDMLGYGFTLDVKPLEASAPELYNYITNTLHITKVTTVAELIDLYFGFYRLDGVEDTSKNDYRGIEEYEVPKVRRSNPKADSDVSRPPRPGGSTILSPRSQLIVQMRTWVISELDKLIANNDFKINIFRLLAYQKIYSDFYKRDDYEATNPQYFNIDDYYTGTTLNTLDVDRLLGMLRLRYRWLPKDYFTGVVPSELVGLEKQMGEFADLQALKVKADSDKAYIDGNATYYQNAVSTKSIRAMFAIEKLLRLTRRAGGFDYISQTAAHYGFDVPEGRGDKVEFVGGYSLNIDVNEITATASTEDAVVGQSFARGIGSSSNNKDIRFTAKEHGVFMVVSSIVPDLDYNGYGLNRFNTKFERGDYFQPELSELGLQPVYGYELENIRNATDRKPHNAIMGYGPAYGEYKTAFDTLHGEFRNARTLSAWSANQLVDYNSNMGFLGASVSTLKINPKALDRVFSVMYDGREMTDQFMLSTQFICKIIRPMSITGQNL